MVPGFWEILLVVLVILFFFGAGRLPRLMEDLAKGIKSFKQGLKDEDAPAKTLPREKSGQE